MKKNFGITRFIAGTAAAGIIASSLVSCDNEKKDTLVQGYTYTDASLLIDKDMIGEEDKEVIYSYIENLYTEKNNEAGFCLPIDYDMKKFERLYYTIKLSEMNGNGTIPKDTEAKIRSLFRIKEQSMLYSSVSAYDYFYYVCIKKKLDNTFDQEALYKVLDGSIDSNNGLVYLLSPDEGLNVELLFTSEILELAKDNDINIEKYDFYSKIDKIYNDFEFLTPDRESSFYLAGADVLYALRNAEDVKKYTEPLKKWFAEWKKEASVYKDDTVWSLIEYESYCDIAELFGEKNLNETVSRLDTLKVSDIADFEDNVQSNIYKYVYKKYFSECADDFIADTDKYIEDYLSDKGEKNKAGIFDLGEQYYAQDVAYAADFEFDHNLFSNAVENRFSLVMQDDTVPPNEKIINTFYYLMLKDTSSLTDPSFDKNMIAEKTDKALTDYLKEDEPDIKTIATALEIKSNISPQIRHSDKTKITGLINDYIKSGLTDMNSVYVKKCDHILGTEIAGDDWIVEKLSELEENGGYKCAENEPADLRSMYCVCTFNSSVPLLTVNDTMKEKIHSFAEKFYDNGLYRYDIDYNLVDTRSIFYGLTLSTFNGGIYHE